MEIHRVGWLSSRATLYVSFPALCQHASSTNITCTLNTTTQNEASSTRKACIPRAEELRLLAHAYQAFRYSEIRHIQTTDLQLHRLHLKNSARFSGQYTFLEEDYAGSPGAGGSTKTFPGMLDEFRVSSCGLESRQSFKKELGTIKG